MTFDPNAAASPDSGLFGLPTTRGESGIVIIPVPFDATTSYGAGTANGPEAVFEASKQVDLHDHHFGQVYEAGLFMEPIEGRLAKLNARARRLAEPIIERGGASSGDDEAAVRTIFEAGEAVRQFTYERFRTALKEGRTPGLLGGDHSTPLGAIQACAEHVAGASGGKGGKASGKGAGLGILHLDAHMDLRSAFEGFTYSHASIMYNVLKACSGVTRLVQIGIRDFGADELAFARSQKARVGVLFDADLAEAQLAGKKFLSLIDPLIKSLPQQVYVSVDIDALDPSLCPHTGTPVPGGLSFNQAALILKRLADSGRNVVGFDLVEVSPPRVKGLAPIDQITGARMLYKLCGLAAASRARR